MDLKIAHGSSQSYNVITQTPDASVARSTQQPTNFASLVIVIHMKRFTGGLADSASAALLSQHRIVITSADSVSGFQLLTANITVLVWASPSATLPLPLNTLFALGAVTLASVGIEPSPDMTGELVR